MHKRRAVRAIVLRSHVLRRIDGVSDLSGWFARGMLEAMIAIVKGSWPTDAAFLVSIRRRELGYLVGLLVPSAPV